MPSLLSPAALPTLAASAISSMSTGDVGRVAQWPGLEGPAAVAWDAEKPGVSLAVGKDSAGDGEMMSFLKKTCTLWKICRYCRLKAHFFKEHAI